MTSSPLVGEPGASQPCPEGALLEGVRVVELATIVMAPSACAMLSDFGAEVIKIEAPGRGDLYRYFQDLPGMPDSEIPYCFLLDGRNKKSVVIDLKEESSQAVAHRLIGTADVFLTNFHNSVLDDLGMTWDRLREVNPRLIFAHGTGYGHTGPEAEKPGYDQVCYWTRSGLVATFTPVDGHLGPLGCGTGDHPTGVTLFSAVLAGLLKRERTGTGSYVTTWSERFTRYEIAYSLVSNLDDIVADEQLEAIGMFRDLDHPQYGRLRTVDSPVLIEGEDKVKPQPAPELGEHTGDLLRELGLDAAEIADLADQGIISGRL